MSNIKRVIIEERTKEWFDFRKYYIGSSDIGKIMGQSKHELALSVFLKKIGMMDKNFEGNLFTHFGIVTEDTIAQNYWQYWDPAEENSFIQNYLHKKKIRTCRFKKGFLINKKYPYFASSLDRVISTKNGFKLTTGEPVKKPCPLEIKTINPWEFDNWESIPTTYIIQVMQQMIVSETDYAEIAILSGDKTFHVFPIEFRDDLASSIIEHGKLFNEILIKGRQLKRDYDLACLENDFNKQQEILVEIDRITPLPAPGQEKLYEEHLHEKVKSEEREGPQIIGNDNDHEKAKEVFYLNEIIKHMDQRLTLLKNNLKEKISFSKYMMFEDNKSKVTFKTKSNGHVHWAISLEKPIKDQLCDLAEHTKNVISYREKLV